MESRTRSNLTGSSLERATRWWPVAPVLLTLALLVTSTSSSAGYTNAVANSTSFGSGDLTGANAPASGVATFRGDPTALSTCQLTWTALSGGAAVADRFEVIDTVSGATVTTTATVGAGSFSTGQTQVVRTYRLLTRAAANWVSPTGETATAACSLGDVTSVGAGVDSSCAVKSDRTLWCWGLGEKHTIGDGTLLLRTAPVQVGSATTWREVAVGHVVACATRTDGTGWCWGENGDGAVGDGTTTARTSPVQLPGSWNQLAAGDRHACGIKTDATLWCWGASYNGQVGTGYFGAVLTPTQVGSGTWSFVSTATYHTCGIRTDSTLWCWGANWNGQVGSGDFDDQGDPVQITGSWSHVSAGGSATCAVKTDGTLWCWGSDYWRQGASGVSQNVMAPMQVGSVATWTRVALSYYATCATRSNGTLWCWGTDAFGSTAQGTATWTADETPVQVGVGTNWSVLSAGSLHFCAVRTDASLSCWGNDGAGATGLGGSSMLTYAQVGSGTSWGSASIGGEFSCGSKVDATLWCWGSNDTAQLGYEGADGNPTPVQITLGGVTTVAAYSSGSSNACAIRSTDNHLYCWGGNSGGQLGLGYTSWRETAFRVGSPNTYTSVSTGYDHTCAVRSDSTLWCWGENWTGQLGDGSTTQRSAPVQVSGGGAWTSVAVGPYHTCALKSGGTLWCWGANWDGQLGIGNHTAATTPTQVGSLTYSSVNVGMSHSCAIRSSVMWCWGDNHRGQLGDGTTTERTSPVQAGSANNWDAVSAGRYFTCGHRVDATVWCWGTNSSGQFGSGSTSLVNSSPVQVGSSTSLIRSSKVGFHSCIVRSAGTFWCAGGNTRGQLGVEDATTTPAVVAGAWRT